jgi:hypothetical protein
MGFFKRVIKEAGRVAEDAAAPFVATGITDFGATEAGAGATAEALGLGASGELGSPGELSASGGPRDQTAQERLESRMRLFEAKRAVLGRTAEYGGATRSRSDADLLGFGLPSAKRKAQKRSILG